MKLVTYYFALIRIVGFCVAEHMLADLTSTPAYAQSSTSKRDYEITRFELVDIKPQPITFGDAVTGNFLIELRFDPNIKPDITDLISNLVISVDTVRIPTTISSSITAPLDVFSAESRAGEKLSGTVSFKVRAEDVGPSFLGVKWGGTHLIYLVETGSDAKSNFTSIIIQSPAWVRWGILSLGNTVLVLLLGLATWTAFSEIGKFRTTKIAPKSRKSSEAISSTSDEYRVPVPLPDVPDPLLTALSKGDAMLVLGGGASAQAGFPTSPELLDQLLERLGDKLPPGVLRALRKNYRDASSRLATRVGGLTQIMDAIISSTPRERIANEI
jgi:hypothetical protein